MVYISRDGSVGGRPSLWTRVVEFVQSILDLFSLFFLTITNPKSLENRRNTRRTFAERNQGSSYRPHTKSGQKLGSRGKANIKGIDGLKGDAKCAMGG